MPASDPIADGLTKIRNASRAKHAVVEVRASKLLEQMLIVMQSEGFVRAYRVVETPPSRTLRVHLKYAGKRPAITGLRRMSNPGRRMYRNAKHLPRVLRGLGIAVLSTSRGLMTDREAYQQKVGGEILCYVW